MTNFRHTSLLIAVLGAALVVTACDGTPGGGGGDDEPDGGTSPVIQFDAGPPPDAADGGVVDAGPVNSFVVVTSITPPTGPLLGGNRVILEGANFDPSCNVTFDGVDATNCLQLTTQRFSCEVPPAVEAGPADVQMRCALGIGESIAGYTYFSPIQIASITPNSGSTQGGTPVVIVGTDLNADMIVLIGARQVVDLVVDADGTRATAKTAPASDPGRVDVAAFDTFGRSVLPLAFAYVADLTLSAVTPSVVEPGAIVELVGAGFTERDDVATEAAIADTDAARSNLISDERLRVVVPGVGNGVHDVSVARGAVAARLDDALVILPAATGTFTLTAVVPRNLDVVGGDVAVLAGEGLSTVTAVTIGGAAATFTILDDRRVQLTTPAHAAGAADVVVTRADASTQTLVGGVVYAAELTVTGTSPESGPTSGGASGGGTITVSGSGFAAGVEVEVGGIACDNVVVVSPTSLTCDLPAGAAGLVDVVVTGLDGQRAVAPAAFLFEAAPRVLGVRPSRGGLSGDVFVTVTGAGFETAKRLAETTAPPGTTRVVAVQFGGQFADPRELTIVSDNVLTVRTPLSEPGLSDVVVSVCDVNVAARTCDLVPGTEVPPPGEPVPPLWQATASDVFTVFDPASILGGTRGGPVDGAMYITAYDATTGFPVPNLVAFIGSVGESGGTPVAADITNVFGQATLSGPEIYGPQTITIAGDRYEYSTLVDVNAAEITLYLSNIGGEGEGEGQPPPQPPPAQIRGRVFGFAKEFFDPAALGPDELALCVVVTTARDEFAGTPNPGGANVVFEEGGEFFIAQSRPGRLGLVALAGIFNLTTQEFRFRQMGVRREVFPTFGVTLTDQDIELSIPLDRDIDLSLPDAPLDFEIEDITARFGNGPDITRVIPFIQLGGEGAFAYTTAIGGTRSHALETMPDVPGEMLTFVAGAYSTTGFNMFTNQGTADLTQNSVLVTGDGVFWSSTDFNGDFEVIGKILVVEMPDGTRFASDILGVVDASTIRIRDRAPVGVSGRPYHIGDAGIPSSEVIQDGVGDLRGGVTIQPVLGIPEVISPIDNGVLEHRTLRWKKAPGEQPTIHLMYVFEPFNFEQLWSFYIEGSRTKVPIPVVPRFDDFVGVLPLHEVDFLDEAFVPPDELLVGGLAWQHEAIFTPGLEYTNWSLLDIGTRGRRAWTTNLKIFVHGRDD